MSGEIGEMRTALLSFLLLAAGGRAAFAQDIPGSPPDAEAERPEPLYEIDADEALIADELIVPL